jgi:hypothetical protein
LQVATLGMISGPPDRLEQGEAWYADGSSYPGGVVAHLAASLGWRFDRLDVGIDAAASGGYWAAPGAFTTVHGSWRGLDTELDLLLGYCSSAYFTPEGDKGDLEWMAGVRGRRDVGALRFSAGWELELPPLPPFPQTFRESRNQLDAGILVCGKTKGGLACRLEGDTRFERQWSREGIGETCWELAAGATTDWRFWNFALFLKEQWGGDSQRHREVQLSIRRDPSWGEASLKAEFRHKPDPGLHLAAALETGTRGKLFFIRLETADVLQSLEDRPWLSNLKLGWEVKSKVVPK